MSNNTKQFGFFTALILLAAFSRFLPHPVNFSPLMAVCMFAGAHFSKKHIGIGVALGTVFLTDVVLNNTIYAQFVDGFTLFYKGFLWQYAAYMLIGILATVVYSKKITLLNVPAGAIGSGVLFFVLSNFGVWVSGTTYPPTWPGLVACYTAGLPFLKATLLSNVAYSTLLFGGVYLAQYQAKSLRPLHIKYHYIG